MMTDISRKSKYTRNDVTVEITRSESEICLVLGLTINGMPANIYDFGLMKDLEPSKAPPCGCGNRVFVSSYLSDVILKRYNLTRKQGEDLLLILKKALNIGYCKRCK